MNRPGRPVATPMAAAPGVASPCVNVCRIEPATGWCVGCLRTLDEIAAWSTLDDDARRAVWAEIGQRRLLLRHEPPAPAPRGAAR